MPHRRSVWLAAALSVLVCSAGRPALAQPPSKALTPQQYDEFLTARILSTTTDSIRSRRSISDEELKVLGDIARKQSLPATVRADALKPLTLVRPDTLTASQKEKLTSLLGDILRTDDTTTDSGGYLKTYALSASTLLPRKAFASEVKTLRADKRPTVRATARRIQP